MPPFRHDPGRYVTNGGSALNHGAPAYHAASGWSGIALKQQATAWDEPFATQAQIKAAEPYYLQTTGECRVKLADHAGITSPAKGDLVYITSGNALTKTATSNFAFGEIVEVGPERGMNAGFVRIDMSVRV
jgi:hypothetical protein